ncbi:hypothetical protein F2Q69_00005607 [Brassica cretica]|uniref:Uncharacterized protein n=2 Tax=Brassica cretica TaxID=69181 RepID=A0A8S9PAS5_BRACR|nr:hypothetical protein F2Q69_00005607 [Brassica cretica]KAF3552075.1 hypothetical protein DY000_02006348 [Brassica cretica]
MTHPHEEYMHMKQLKKYNNMLGCIADAHYGIPTGCPCWGRMVDEVSPGKKFPGDFDTLPGRKYFVCDKFEDEVKGLLQRVDEMVVEITDLKDQLKRVQILK